MSESAPIVRRRATQERSRDTRQRILEAAVTALVEAGYAGATTLRIQEIAGVSRGRLLHHYPSRDDLLVAALAHLTEVRTSGLAEGRVWPADPGERIDAIVDTVWETFGQPYFWASAELWLAARWNPRLAEVLLPQERRVGAFIASKLIEFFGEELAAREDYQLACDLLITSMRGVAMTYAFRSQDARLDPHLAEWKRLTRSLLLGG